MRTAGFSRFVALDEENAPELLHRVFNEELPFDSMGIKEKTHVQSRMIAKPRVGVEALAERTIDILSQTVRCNLADAGGLVLASCFPENIQQTAESLARKFGIRGDVRGIDVACSGFTAGTELAADIACSSGKSVVLATTEVTSRMINWDKPTGGMFRNDDAFARGKAAKIFGDASAATVVKPPAFSRDFDILDAFAYDMEDPDKLLTLTPVDYAKNIDGSIRQGRTPCINMPGKAGAKLMKLGPVTMANAVRMSMLRALRSGQLDSSEHLCHVLHHQANGAMAKDMEKLLNAMGYGDLIVWNEIADQGNVSAASIPTALSRVQEGIDPGEIVAMPSVGAGSPGFREGWLTAGCVLARKTDPQRQ